MRKETPLHEEMPLKTGVGKVKVEKKNGRKRHGPTLQFSPKRDYFLERNISSPLTLLRHSLKMDVF